MISFILFTVGSFVSQQPINPKTMLVDEDIRVYGSHLSRDGTTLGLSGGRQKGGDWKIIDLKTGNILVDGGEGNCRCWGAWAIRLSEDKSLMAVGGNYNKFFLVNPKNGELIWDLTNAGHVGVIQDLRFTPDGRYLISAANDMTIRVWDISNKNAHSVFRFISENPGFNLWQGLKLKEPAKQVFDIGGKYSVVSIDLSPDGKTLAVAGSIESKVLLLNLESGKITRTFESKTPRIGSVTFMEDGKWLQASGYENRRGDNRSMEIWDLESNERVAHFGKDEKMGAGGVISPDKKTMIIAQDGVRVWDIATRKLKYSYFTTDDPRLPREKIYSDGSKQVQKEVTWARVGFLPDSKSFYYIPGDWYRTEVYFHDTATGEPVDFRERVKSLLKAK